LRKNVAINDAAQMGLLAASKTNARPINPKAKPYIRLGMGAALISCQPLFIQLNGVVKVILLIGYGFLTMLTVSVFDDSSFVLDVDLLNALRQFRWYLASAAIKSIPPDLINAALVDGASEFQVARRIIIPLLKWPIMFVTAWQTLSLMASYDVILMVWGAAQGASPSEVLGITKVAGVTVWSLYAYTQAFSQYQYGYAASISLVLVAIGLGLIVLYFKVFGFRRLMEPSRVEV